MGKKKKEKIPAEIRERVLYQIKKLLLNESYKQDIEELSNIIKKDKGTGDWIKKFIEFRRKYSIFYPYSIERLQEVKEALIKGDGEKLKGLAFRYYPPIRLVPYKKHGRPNDINPFGYLTFEIKPDTPRYIIHYGIDKLLDYHQGLNQKDIKKRFRKESISTLQVWEERRSRKSFNQIAKELSIKEPTAKKRFYKAYELLYGKKYNPDYYEKPEIKKAYLKKECSTCKERETCKELCPDVIAFVEQDNKTYLREYLLP